MATSRDELRDAKEDLDRSIIPIGNGRGQRPAIPQTVTWVGYRVPSTDHHGHSDRVSVSIQPGHHRMLQTIHGTHYWPYRTVADIIRHAIDRHIRWIESQEAIPSITKQVDAIMEVLREDEFLTDFRTMFEKLQAQVSIYVGLGANLDARSLVSRVKTFINAMPADDPWKLRYETELQERFGHLIENAKGVSLRSMAEPVNELVEGEEEDETPWLREGN